MSAQKVAGEKSIFKTTVRRLKKDKTAVAGFLIIVCLVFSAFFAPWLTPYDPAKQNYEELLLPPSLHNPLGTDQYGRDMLTRILYGCRYAILIGVAVVAIQLAVGVSLGLTAGFYGGMTESIIMRFTDVMLAIPGVVLAVTIAGMLGGGIHNCIIAVGAIGWRAYTRLVRAEVLSIKESVYIEAERAIGCSNARIILRHVLPNAIGPVIAYMPLSVASAIIWAAALSFLGLGAQPPTPEWGALLADGREFMQDAWWIATFPGIAILITVMGFNFFGDALRNALDPKTIRGMAR